VQRDPADNLPCIYSSSLKGAFREYFEEGPNKIATKLLADQIFGAGLNKQSSSQNAKGTHIFHQASLLSLPARSNVKPFFNATCPDILKKLLDDSELFSVSLTQGLKNEIQLLLTGSNTENKIDVFSPQIPNLKIEDYSNFNFKPANLTEVSKIFGENLILMTDEDFKDLCSDYNLPVIARNNLENGQSQNLWYEQVVPRQARFYFFTVTSEQTDNFLINVNNKIVQIGANASIGYGLCKITNF
jgi:CRISPR-associated protein Cmr4